VLSAESILNPRFQYKSSVEILNAAMSDKQGLQERSVPVYDLMIEDYHEFFADGVLAHNCDSLSYIDQMVTTSYRVDNDEEDYEPLDVISGV
jgi:hypothetical protein